jgi:carboxymethylenebutenolidase
MRFRARFFWFLLAVTTLAACQTETPEPTAEEKNVEAMAREHADDSAKPSAATEEAPARTVISERLAYAEVNDELVYGYFAFPEDMIEPLPAVIMIHEWWGLNDNIRAMADRLAAEGYIVLAVDMFDGNVATSPQDAQVQMKRVVDNPSLAVENLRQALNFVADTAGAPTVATLGWCFGGGWSLNAAVEFPEEVDATVIYYGHVTDDEERLDAIQSPILGLFAEDDRGIQVQSVRAFESTLNRLQKEADIHVYPGVGHAFANPTGNRYDAASASDAWDKTLEFLRAELQVDDDS